ncbi:MAG: stage V sporulation protein AE, partial [Longicatena caecimuris]
ILLGMFDLTAAGITSGILFAFFVAILCKPKS